MQPGGPSLNPFNGRMFSIVCIGIITGLIAVLFRFLIKLSSQIFFDSIFNTLAFMQSYAIVLLPALGGLTIGFAKNFLAGQFKNYSVSGVIAELTECERFIPVGVIWWQLLAASITMGSGGSVGPEGPIILMGCAIGSIFARKLSSPAEERRNLIAAGAAGGIAASFSAPLAGIVFAQEVLLGKFTRKNFMIFALSSLIATYVAQIFSIASPIFRFPLNLEFALSKIYLLPLLGIFAGLFGSGFIRFFHYMGQQWNNYYIIQPVLKPMVGGLLVGVIGLALPEALGEGHEAMQLALLGGFSAALFFSLTFAKALTTSISLGSGVVGGVFAPTLFIGAMLGGFFGTAITAATGNEAGGFAVIGMAAVFAAVFKAPMSAVLLAFELTRNYNLLLPIMMTVIIANYVSLVVEKESIYTFNLAKKGLDINSCHPYHRKEYGEQA